jgi:hypothetical protein
MFSIKAFVKYPQSTFIEEKEGDNYTGKYIVTLPCGIFSDEELTNKIGDYTIAFENLSIEECTPEYIYGLAMSKFQDSTHII